MGRACKNQQNRMHLETVDGIMELRQITGTLVREIVCYVHPGDQVSRGERIGMIRFGSRVEVSIPVGYTLLVNKGDKVRAGETVVAVRNS
jgi:phosphatidylserine decarboxylase